MLWQHGLFSFVVLPRLPGPLRKRAEKSVEASETCERYCRALMAGVGSSFPEWIWFQKAACPPCADGSQAPPQKRKLAISPGMYTCAGGQSAADRPVPRTGRLCFLYSLASHSLWRCPAKGRKLVTCSATQRFVIPLPPKKRPKTRLHLTRDSLVSHNFANKPTGNLQDPPEPFLQQ